MSKFIEVTMGNIPRLINLRHIQYIGINRDGETFVAMKDTHFFINETYETLLNKIEEMESKNEN